MKNTKKHLVTSAALAIVLFTGFTISAAKNAQAMIAQLKAQEAMISTIAQQPIHMNAFRSNTPEINEFKKLVEQDIKSIKEDIGKIRQSMTLIIQIQQEMLLAPKE